MKGKTLKQLAKLLSCQGSFQKIIITGFEADSRQIKEGMIFIALKGDRVDGHDFLSQVAENKAIGAIVSQEYKGSHYGLALFFVKDVLGSLQLLAKESYVLKKRITVAVTGSVGKTTTKEFIATLLEANYSVDKTLGNANSQVGVPLTILNNEEGREVFVIEMGMSAPGQIKQLTEMAPPDIAVLTAIGRSHTAFFHEGIEAIALAKSEIFSHRKTRLAIINERSRGFPIIAKLEKEKIYFGGKEVHSDYSITIEPKGVVIHEKGKKSPPMTLTFEASHLLENFCAAVAVARALGLNWDQIAGQATKLHPCKRRYEKIEKEGVTYLNDAYNASPESMCAALANLPAPAPYKKRIAVLGDMRELGVYSESSHEQVAYEALSTIEHLLCLGKGCLPMVEIFQQHQRPVEYFEDFVELRSRLIQLKEPGDVILLKGANSHALWRLVEE